MRHVTIEGREFALRFDPFDADDSRRREALDAQYAKCIEASGFPTDRKSTRLNSSH